MKLEEKKDRAGLWLEENGSYGFSDGSRIWISGKRNVPIVDGELPEEKAERKDMTGSEARTTLSLAYRLGECVTLTRTVEFRPETDSFTVLDERGSAWGERTVTETLYSPYPIRMTDGNAVIDADGMCAEILIRNQENLRVERPQQSGAGTVDHGYCLKWEIAGGRTYTCCQIELKKNEKIRG